MKFALILLAALIQTFCAQTGIYVYGQLFLPNLNISGTTNEVNYIGIQEKPNYPFLGVVNNTFSAGTTLIDVVAEFSAFPQESDVYTTFSWRLIFNMKDIGLGPYKYRYFFMEGYGYSLKSSGRSMLNCSVSFAETEPEMDMPALTMWNGWIGYVDYPH
jgi:hypothetical protein